MTRSRGMPTGPLLPWLERFLAHPLPSPPSDEAARRALDREMQGVCGLAWLIEGDESWHWRGELSDDDLRRFAAHIRNTPHEEGWWDTLLRVLANPLPREVLADLIARGVTLASMYVRDVDFAFLWQLALRATHPHQGALRGRLLSRAYQDPEVSVETLRSVLSAHCAPADLLREQARRRRSYEALTSAWPDAIEAARTGRLAEGRPEVREVWCDTLRHSPVVGQFLHGTASGADKEEAIAEYVRDWPDADIVLRPYRARRDARLAARRDLGPDEVEAILAETSELAVLIELACHPHATLSQVLRIFHSVRWAREAQEASATRRRPSVRALRTSEVYVRLEEVEQIARQALTRRATHHTLSPAEARHLETAADPDVRLALAANPRTPRDVLERLVALRDVHLARFIRQAARRHLRRLPRPTS